MYMYMEIQPYRSFAFGSAPATFFSLTFICALFSCEFNSSLVALLLLGYQVYDLVIVPQTLEITKLISCQSQSLRDNAILKQVLLQVADVVCTSISDHKIPM